MINVIHPNSTPCFLIWQAKIANYLHEWETAKKPIKLVFSISTYIKCMNNENE